MEERKEYIINYRAFGKAYSDYEIEQNIEKIFKRFKEGGKIDICQEILFDALRLQIVKEFDNNCKYILNTYCNKNQLTGSNIINRFGTYHESNASFERHQFYASWPDYAVQVISLSIKKKKALAIKQMRDIREYESWEDIDEIEGKIKKIKFLRKKYDGLGLKEAKDLIEDRYGK